MPPQPCSLGGTKWLRKNKEVADYFHAKVRRRRCKLDTWLDQSNHPRFFTKFDREQKKDVTVKAVAFNL